MLLSNGSGTNLCDEINSIHGVWLSKYGIHCNSMCYGYLKIQQESGIQQESTEHMFACLACSQNPISSAILMDLLYIATWDLGMLNQRNEMGQCTEWTPLVSLLLDLGYNILSTNLALAPTLYELVCHPRSDICPSGMFVSPRSWTGSVGVISCAVGAHKILMGRRGNGQSRL